MVNHNKTEAKEMKFKLRIIYYYNIIIHSRCNESTIQ